MAKVTIVITDDGNDAVRFRAEFDPPLLKGEYPTSAQGIGAMLCDQATDMLEDASSKVEVLDFETGEKPRGESN